MSTVKSFVDDKDSASSLEEMAVDQLQTRSVREANIALIIISEAISCQCEDLVRNKTGEFAVLLKALAALRRSLPSLTDKARR